MRLIYGADAVSGEHQLKTHSRLLIRGISLRNYIRIDEKEASDMSILCSTFGINIHSRWNIPPRRDLWDFQENARCKNYEKRGVEIAMERDRDCRNSIIIHRDIAHTSTDKALIRIVKNNRESKMRMLDARRAQGNALCVYSLMHLLYMWEPRPKRISHPRSWCRVQNIELRARLLKSQ